MRISDWSSDVCSSDLSPQAGAAEHVGADRRRAGPSRFRRRGLRDQRNPILGSARTEAGDDRRQTRRQGPGRDFVLPSPPYASRGTAPALQIHRSEYRADSSRARRQAARGAGGRGADDRALGEDAARRRQVRHPHFGANPDGHDPQPGRLQEARRAGLWRRHSALCEIFAILWRNSAGGRRDDQRAGRARMASTALRSDPQGGLSVAEIIPLLETRRAQRGWSDGHDNVSRLVPKRVSARPSRSDTADAALQGFRILVIDPQPLTRSEEHTSELQSLMRSSYAVFCLKKKHYPDHNRDID